MGGDSGGPYSGLNLGIATKDDPAKVRANRQRVARTLGISAEWMSLKQVHGTGVVEVTGQQGCDVGRQGDALATRASGIPLAVMAADCLPVALIGSETRAVAHAGWRGLCAGVLQAAVKMFAAGDRPVAWIGPSIGPCHYQVGAEVVDAFRSANPASPDFWTPDDGRFLFDMRAAARWVLRRSGAEVHDYDPPCTYCDSRFYSYRRDGETGRHAVVVWR